jgi:hypothetical protein
MKVYIVNYNRLTWPKAMADWLGRVAGIEPVFVDNASTYEPLLEYYETCPHKVIRLDENLGNRAPWIAEIVFEAKERFYAVTDPDLDLTGIPYDVFDVLTEGLVRFPGIVKSGVSLRMDDLPSENPLTAQIVEWESQFWQRPLDDRFFDADVDTTLAVYALDHGFASAQTNRAVRAAPPYTARHLSWYMTPDDVGDEEVNYLQTANPNALHWTRIIQERGLFGATEADTDSS